MYVHMKLYIFVYRSVSVDTHMSAWAESLSSDRLGLHVFLISDFFQFGMFTYIHNEISWGQTGVYKLKVSSYTVFSVPTFWLQLVTLRTDVTFSTCDTMSAIKMFGRLGGVPLCMNVFVYQIIKSARRTLENINTSWTTLHSHKPRRAVTFQIIECKI